MAARALSLVQGGAFVHASRYLLVKQSSNPTAFLFLSLIVSVCLIAAGLVALALAG
jgi:hypothetical protein